MIISRKATDLKNIQKNTFENYINELIDKYPVGSKIANSDIGDKLFGDFFLEIPETNKSFNKIEEYIKLAKDKGVTIIFQAE